MYNSFILSLARFSGLFLVSPLFSKKGISLGIRWGLSLICTLLLAPHLASHFPIHSGLSQFIQDPIALVMQSFQELFIGYLIGFLFSLIFEAAAFAGQLIGTMMGLSATELLDPILISSQPLMARFFSLIAFILFFALDLHHSLLRLLYETFHLFPPMKYPLTLEIGNVAIQGISLLFKQALSLAIIPLTMLFSMIAIFAIISRFLPIFWVGFPFQLLIGLFVLSSTLYVFIPFVEKGFSVFSNLVQKLFVNL